MKKLIFVYVLINISYLLFSENQITVNIILKLSPLYGAGEIEIYNGSYSRTSHIMKKINNAKEISLKSVVKEALVEGEYTIILRENGIENNRYIVMNSENIYSEKQGKYFKCRIIDDISRLFILHLLENRINSAK